MTSLATLCSLLPFQFFMESNTKLRDAVKTLRTEKEQAVTSATEAVSGLCVRCWGVVDAVNLNWASPPKGCAPKLCAVGAIRDHDSVTTHAALVRVA